MAKSETEKVIQEYAPNTNEFLTKLEDIKTKFNVISKQVAENNDELKRLQGEYRVTIELGLKLGYLTETKPEEIAETPDKIEQKEENTVDVSGSVTDKQ